MTTDPLMLTGEVADATDRLLRTAATFDEANLAAASLLPEWSRGHVLAHLARNADAFVNLLTSARTGQALPMYSSAAARTAISRPARGPPAEQLATYGAPRHGLTRRWPDAGRRLGRHGADRRGPCRRRCGVGPAARAGGHHVDLTPTTGGGLVAGVRARLLHEGRHGLSGARTRPRWCLRGAATATS